MSNRSLVYKVATKVSQEKLVISGKNKNIRSHFHKIAPKVRKVRVLVHK